MDVGWLSRGLFTERRSWIKQNPLVLNKYFKRCYLKEKL